MNLSELELLSDTQSFAESDLLPAPVSESDSGMESGEVTNTADTPGAADRSDVVTAAPQETESGSPESDIDGNVGSGFPPVLDGVTLPEYELAGGDTVTETSEDGKTVTTITYNYYIPAEYLEEGETLNEDESESETLYLVGSVWADSGIIPALTILSVSTVAGFVLSSLPALCGMVAGKITNYLPKNVG